MIVADTNLIVYDVIEGERSAAASRVRRRDAHWVAPTLWRSEFRNVLVQHVRHDRLSPERARAAWSIARSLVRDVEVDPLAALDAAFAHDLSGYDAEFIALADTLGVPLVTDDRRVLGACPDLAVSLDAFGESDNNTPDETGR